MDKPSSTSSAQGAAQQVVSIEVPEARRVLFAQQRQPRSRGCQFPGAVHVALWPPGRAERAEPGERRQCWRKRISLCTNQGLCI